MLNGKGVVYEIKTELDKLDRLDNQINDYYEVFNYVVVITNDKHLIKVMARYKDTTVGILVLTSRNTLSEVQKPKENNSLLNTKAMYNFYEKKKEKELLHKIIWMCQLIMISQSMMCYLTCLKKYQ